MCQDIKLKIQNLFKITKKSIFTCVAKKTIKNFAQRNQKSLSARLETPRQGQTKLRFFGLRGKIWDF